MCVIFFRLSEQYPKIDRYFPRNSLTSFTCNPSQRKKRVVYGGEHDRKKNVGASKAHIYVCINTRKKSGLNKQNVAASVAL